ncbi:MAG: amidohydrolase, partial [Terriglobales bacterium]
MNLAASCLAACALALGAAAGPPAPDLVLVNGNIYTVDANLGRVQALAVREGRIVAAGTDAEISRSIGPKTRVIDLKGGFVMPGFNVAHLHLALASKQLLNVDLEGTRSIPAFQKRIRERLKEYGAGDWVVGGGWDHSLLEEKRVPTRFELDAVTTDHPVFLQRVDWHSAVVNSKALALAGITRQTPDPPGGLIVRDANGEPTGWVKDHAVDLVTRLIPPVTLERRKRGVRQILELAARLGVTSMHDDSIRFEGWDT